ncbi:hypothetical protein Y032_0624g781 [Ancylostoma ceylanicum]|nr:hypothetical protein Y032_0624g781 [Ancylostoma ceylanicum]
MTITTLPQHQRRPITSVQNHSSVMLCSNIFGLSFPGDRACSGLPKNRGRRCTGLIAVPHRTPVWIIAYCFALSDPDRKPLVFILRRRTLA